ncbi:hypothetical protein ACFYM2_27975 [Streptomyces sp. NPDC006711]|uniref:DUF7848 domain-containing protein n=1 Tax=unclassified Streptomyces TaxID=2593676 RepID=UPI0036762AF2
MSIRSTARFVRYRVMAHPDGPFSVSATCVKGACHFVVLPTDQVDKASQAMRQHTANTGHAVFTRTVQDTAVVVLADRAEQERRAQVNALEYRYLGGAAEDARADTRSIE